jgi:hypothetical protein
MRNDSHRREIPPSIHVVNILALLLSGLILLLTAVVRAYQLVVLLPMLVLLVVYWRFRTNPRVVACYFGVSLGLLGWILICEHIVTIDNIFESQISQSLPLDFRLGSYVDTTLHTKARRYLEPCCNDPLTWHYQPGSRYRTTFDCTTCNEPYEVQVDETGYLNRHPGLMQSHQPIDLFVAGDSVLQGMGVPSVIEALQAQLSLSMWNLSIQAYGPRQKISALIAYALPKEPRWLIVEFYAGNDLHEAIRDDVCASMGDFRCRYNGREVRQRLAQHLVYPTIFEVSAAPTDIFATFADATTHNFTLATTRYLINAVKGSAKISTKMRQQEQVAPAASPRVGERIPGFEFRVRQGQWSTYLKAGMALTQNTYERLMTKIEGMEHPPTVILLYHPTPYEVYREIWQNPDSEADQTSAWLREALSIFAQAHGWRFLDLTEPLRHEVQARQVWLYGQYDRSHFSPHGTAVVASVLVAELVKIIAPEQSSWDASESRTQGESVMRPNERRGMP